MLAGKYIFPYKHTYILIKINIYLLAQKYIFVFTEQKS